MCNMYTCVHNLSLCISLCLYIHVYTHLSVYVYIPLYTLIMCFVVWALRFKRAYVGGGGPFWGSLI